MSPQVNKEAFIKGAINELEKLAVANKMDAKQLAVLKGVLHDIFRSTR